MLTQYKNIDQILSAKQSLSAQRLDSTLLQTIDTNKEIPVSFNDNIINKSTVEFHIYSGDTWVTGQHKNNSLLQVPVYFDSITKNQIQFLSEPFVLDINKSLQDLKINDGTYKLAVNFFKNLIGNYEEQYLRIDEISPDRKEIKLRALDSSNSNFVEQITNYIETVNQTVESGYFKKYLLNFSRNQCVQFVNSVVIDEYLYVKLYEPLPDTIENNFKCWVVEELKPTYIDTINIDFIDDLSAGNVLSGPNWQANYSYDISTETGLQSWTDLLGSSTSTSQQIIDNYFSGSLSGVKLNIDYSDFNNFIFYSSATERLENFKYKLGLIERYTSQSSVLTGISGSDSTTNAQDFTNLKTALISGFDNFEHHLYYESSSKLTTHPIPLLDANVADLTGSYIDPIPKSNSTVPYIQYSITSSQFQTWYSQAISNASTYDNLNNNSLIKAVPEHIRLQSDSIDVTTFINMLGHHYDILYTYIDHMTKINKREENPKLGMPNELLYSVAKQFGWNLTNGNQHKKLWEYSLGTSETGIPLTGSNSIGDPSVSSENSTYTIWRRIINNLPLLLKSKGTKRSVQALLSCYGIPQSLMTINEYGGPRLKRAPLYDKLNFDYALDLINNTAGTVIVNYTSSIKTTEIRFRTDDVIKTPTLPSTMNLFTIGSNTVTLDYTSGTKGKVQINGTSSADIELFDGGYLSAMLRATPDELTTQNGFDLTTQNGFSLSTQEGVLELVTKKSKYGKIIAAVSASASGSFAFTGSLTLGGTTGGSRLSGQLQELRFWSSNLQDEPFNNHVKAPAAYDGNFDAYNELIFRLPLTQKINHTETSSLSGVEPNSSGITAEFASWTNDTPYDSIEETYYYDAISLGAGTFDDNKIRLESNELVGSLDVRTRAERSQFDKAPLDSAKLGIYFSPQTMIDEDIIAQLGFQSLDDFIGDPGDLNKKSYPDLIQKSQDYWKKYSQKNDMNSYIRIFTLFDLSFFKQLEQLLPARANKLTGLLVQPNILERSKDSILPSLNKFNDSYTTIITQTVTTASADHVLYEGQVDSADVITLSGNHDDEYQAFLTSTDSQVSTTYSYEGVIVSGSANVNLITENNLLLQTEDGFDLTTQTTPNQAGYITVSTPFFAAEAVLPVIQSSSLSEFQQVVYDTPKSIVTENNEFLQTQDGFNLIEQGLDTLIAAETQDYLPAGINNLFYNGSQLTSPDFNISSTETVDGGPVVEFNLTNPNQLIYTNNPGAQGSFIIN
jgi:hypothetical protein|tara:strand:- start:1920 stop:5639 length:3720 start_codon:yes stop_codon:yes gene_type:complete